jgi:hypothetical protein
MCYKIDKNIGMGCGRHVPFYYCLKYAVILGYYYFNAIHFSLSIFNALILFP